MEIRKDYILNRWVIVGTGRDKRPHEFKQKSDISPPTLDVFGPGNESLTPDEIGRIGKPWRVRWFENKFPFLSPEAQVESDEWTARPAFGYHEIIVETAGKKQLWDLGVSDYVDVLFAYQNRLEALSGKKDVKYVQIFKNHGRKAGTSILHSHSQVSALGFVPPVIEEEVKAVKKHGKNVYKKIISVERKSSRLCFESKKVVAFAPYASRFNFEVWVFPKRNVTNLGEVTEQEKEELAEALRTILRQLRKLNAPFNMFLHYHRDLHLHFEITPRLQTWAGFETSSGVIVNEVLPEDAAAFYRKSQGK